jgi:hypothetical protein
MSLWARLYSRWRRKQKQRKCPRFIPPGAVVSYDLRSLWGRGRVGAGDQCRVADLSKTGLSFFTDVPLKPDRTILLTLKLPGGQPPVTLEGRVIYSVPRGAGLSSRFRVGVHFNPFGNRKHQNPVNSLNVLVELERRYSSPPR